jgi:hypothetical protein
MRSGIAAGLMGVGGIFLAFGFTVMVIGIFTRMSSWRGEMHALTTVGTGSLLIGGAMFVLGWLLNRGVRQADDRAAI